jgi:hypothetical protein
MGIMALLQLTHYQGKGGINLKPSGTVRGRRPDWHTRRADSIVGNGFRCTSWRGLMVSGFSRGQMGRSSGGISKPWHECVAEHSWVLKATATNSLRDSAPFVGRSHWLGLRGVARLCHRRQIGKSGGPDRFETNREGWVHQVGCRNQSCKARDHEPWRPCRALGTA